MRAVCQEKTERRSIPALCLFIAIAFLFALRERKCGPGCRISMKTAFSSPEGCAVARRGRKNVEKRKTKMGMGAAHPTETQKNRAQVDPCTLSFEIESFFFSVFAKCGSPIILRSWIPAYPALHAAPSAVCRRTWHRTLRCSWRLPAKASCPRPEWSAGIPAKPRLQCLPG